MPWGGGRCVPGLVIALGWKWFPLTLPACSVASDFMASTLPRDGDSALSQCVAESAGAVSSTLDLRNPVLRAGGWGGCRGRLGDVT